MVIGSVLLPPGIGLATGRWWPAARRGILAIQKENSIVLALCFAAIIAVAWSQNGAVGRQGTVTALVVIAVIWLAVGHLRGLEGTTAPFLVKDSIGDSGDSGSVVVSPDNKVVGLYWASALSRTEIRSGSALRARRPGSRWIWALCFGDRLPC